MALIFAGLAVSAQAANITFNPGSVALTIEPGKSAVANLLVTTDSRNTYTIALDIARGDDLTGWLSPTNFRLSGTTRLPLIVKVPANTKGGTYTAFVIPRAQASGGFTIVIEVPFKKKCDGVLNFKNVQVGPENIWAPKSREVEIRISGTVDVAPDCKVEGTYSMEFNDRLVAGDLALDADGNFDQKIAITVSKKGIAKEGKIYNGKLAVVDAEGNSVSQGFFVKVDHDMRDKKKGLNKN